MRLNDSARALVGGAAIYVVMAACSGAQEVDRRVGMASAAGASGMANGGSGGGGTVTPAEAGLVDALTNPVREAEAQTPAGPTVVEKPCDVAGPYNSVFAEAMFPGKTATQLAQVQAIHRGSSTTIKATWPAGYDFLVTTVFVRDGAVAANCSTDKNGSVTFVLP